MSNRQSGSRQRCARCRRPASHCLCSSIPDVDSLTKILVLQHPDEARHPLNTGRLAVLGLARAQLLVGETFPQLHELLAASPSTFLLFPDDSAVIPQPLQSDSIHSPLLIVPDGTWRKARKIIFANPVLQTLPRWTLRTGPPSRYRVRQTGQPGAVATIEAIVRTLSELEPERDFSPVLQPFEILIRQQIKAMGEGVYRRNYRAT